MVALFLLFEIKKMGIANCFKSKPSSFSSRMRPECCYSCWRSLMMKYFQHHQDFPPTTATVCCVNLWQIMGTEPEAGFNINVCRILKRILKLFPPVGTVRAALKIPQGLKVFRVTQREGWMEFALSVQRKSPCSFGIGIFLEDCEVFPALVWLFSFFFFPRDSSLSEKWGTGQHFCTEVK